MKKEELKNIIKPLIKECLKEVLIEEGFTKMLSESMQSISKEQIPEQPKIVQELKNESTNKNKQSLLEVRKKMLDEIGMNGFDAFAGTVPLQQGGIPNAPAVSVTTFNPTDSGIDISKLMSGKLKATMTALNGKKVK
jgi:hypothetical protein